MTPLKLWLQLTGTSQKEVARRCGVTAATVSKMVNNPRPPRPRSLKMISEAFGVSINELTGAAPAAPFTRHPAELQDAEKNVLNHLSAAWSEFLSLRDQHPEALDDYRRAMHRCQDVIGARVARRLQPDIWR